TQLNALYFACLDVITMSSISTFFVHLIIFFFNVPATADIYTLSLHDALPISPRWARCEGAGLKGAGTSFGEGPRGRRPPAQRRRRVARPPRAGRPRRAGSHSGRCRSHGCRAGPGASRAARAP